MRGACLDFLDLLCNICLAGKGKLLCAHPAPHVSDLQATYYAGNGWRFHTLLPVSSAGTQPCMACWKLQTSLPLSSIWIAATAEAASTRRSCCVGSLEVGCLRVLGGPVTRSRAELHRDQCRPHTDAELA